jgi:hypothetical protein
MRGGWAGQLSSFGKDSKVLQQKIRPGTTRRTLAVAAPHSAMLLVFLVVVVASASISIANPLIYREIINEEILKQNVPFIVRLALLIAGLGLLEAALGLLLTYMATHIGAAVVLSLLYRRSFKGCRQRGHGGAGRRRDACSVVAYHAHSPGAAATLRAARALLGPAHTSRDARVV